LTPRIFPIFFEFRYNSRRRYGMRLTISRPIAEAHGESIRSDKIIRFGRSSVQFCLGLRMGLARASSRPLDYPDLQFVALFFSVAILDTPANAMGYLPALRAYGLRTPKRRWPPLIH
jgi:hypothetical protein